MSGAGATPSAAELAELIARGPREHARRIWQPMEGDRPASVLVPLIPSADGLRVVLTRRSPDLTKHAGEFSFPGGRPEPQDAGPRETALREAHEEIGVAADLVEIIGSLPPTTTYRTGYAITPFVGIINAPPAWVAQVSEVAEVAEPLLTELVAVRYIHTYQRPEGGERLDMPVFPIDEERQVWGATARILDELLVRLAPVIPGAALAYG
ncbi:MAG: CoA pyrophosphatase [Solirubrobacteraceae bacterium]|nr:CoA pyrophosphatase [Solirubrobacteraceae bacterium]